MAGAEIRSIEVPAILAKGGESEVRVTLRDGSAASFRCATPQAPAEWISREGYAFGPPTLFLPKIERAALSVAASAMAAEMGGYWLRYYNSGSRERPAAPMRLVSAAVSDAYPPRRPGDSCGVAQVRLGDGREFSLLTATPNWFARAFAESGLPFYFGPAILFARELSPSLVRRAARAMAAQADRWLCLYDTPRTTLPTVLADFKARLASSSRSQ